MSRLTVLTYLLILGTFYGCIKDDFVQDTIDPMLRITSTVDTIAINTSFQFEAMYLNNVGLEENATVTWESSAPEVISLDNNGLAMAHQMGNAIITATVNLEDTVLQTNRSVQVGMNTTSSVVQKMGTVNTTSSYSLSGDFTLVENENGVSLTFADNYQASTSLPGLYIYLTNNKNTTNNALEIGAVQVFNGTHTYTIPNVGINDYNYVLYFCKPFNVKVGDGKIQ